MAIGLNLSLDISALYLSKDENKKALGKRIADIEQEKGNGNLAIDSDAEVEALRAGLSQDDFVAYLGEARAQAGAAPAAPPPVAVAPAAPAAPPVFGTKGRILHINNPPLGQNAEKSAASVQRLVEAAGLKFGGTRVTARTAFTGAVSADVSFTARTVSPDLAGAVRTRDLDLRWAANQLREIRDAGGTVLDLDVALNGFGYLAEASVKYLPKQ